MSIAALFNLLEPTGNVAASILKAAGSLFNTKQLASIAGVSMRTAQRWLTNAKEQRKPSLNSLRKLAQNIAWQIKTKVVMFIDSPGKKRRTDDTRTRAITIDLSPEEAAAIQESLTAGNEQQAQDRMWEAYGLPPDANDSIVSLDIESVSPKTT